MRQYHAAKQQAPGALLMFRLGDFFELFFEDAITAARELEITLTSRNKEKGEPVPMCGVSAHSVENYIARLIQKGYRVAICDQMEDPRFTKKIVRREITRIVTPGTVTESALLRSHENNYLAAVAVKAGRAGLAYVDISTGEFRATELPAPEAAPALEQLNVRELLVSDTDGDAPSGRWIQTKVEAWTFSADHAAQSLRDHFRLLTLDGLGLAERRLAVSAAGALLAYLKETQKSALSHLDGPSYYEGAGAMLLDAVTVRNLELVEPMFSADLDARQESTLLSVLDLTRTGMGGRLLRRRLLRPELELTEIEARLDAVQWLKDATIPRTRLRDTLGGMLDIERLLSRITVGTASPRDLLGLGRTLAKIPALRAALEGDLPARLALVFQQLDDVAEVRDAILSAIADEPPPNLADGGVVRSGYHAALDELRHLATNARQIIAAIEARERDRTGIASLKVRFNNIFGFYIEISKSNLHLAPADYERKQTLVNAERFTTPELKELEAKVLTAEEKALDLEREIFAQVRDAAAAQAPRIRATAAAVAEIDFHSALAQAALDNRYSRPRFSSDGSMLQLAASRHPVIEKLTERDAQRFIPNDLYLDRTTARVALITGPNMGGKSTYLRQAALISVMAQMGSFVPADEAVLPVVDRVFTRIGASDNLARGRSTFMVEMTETAVILNTATANSLILLDEIGRGTATYDGLALAWAVIEHIHDRTGAFTLFATHYHELTELADKLEGIRNLHVSVKESGDQIIFLRKVEPGSADKSYGIEVARLAALPMPVIERARDILALHEKTEQSVTEQLEAPRLRPGGQPSIQIQLFEPVGYQLAEKIRQLDIDNLKPVEALRILNDLKEELNRQ
ncbi:MAG: DNA mismatch repair protein MutS [Acidobacteria bacterium]|nr:DNA mismatch repair protein MutS [Acidobacteriota bacterium]